MDRHEQPRVRILSRPACHLCDDARVIVATVCEEVGADWDEVDVTGDPVLLDRHADDIPVVLVDGTVIAFWRIDAGRLRAALGQRPPQR